MEKVPFAKTLLTILPHIDRYCDSTHKVNHIDALNSFYGLSDTYSLMQRIIEKTYRAERLYNLKIKTVKYLDTMPGNRGTVLKLLYIKKLRPCQVAKDLGLCERTVFRIVKIGINDLAENLEKIGVNEVIFRQLIMQNTWIRTEYEKQTTSGK
jgi:hypothetical protein